MNEGRRRLAEDSGDFLIYAVAVGGGLVAIVCVWFCLAMWRRHQKEKANSAERMRRIMASKKRQKEEDERLEKEKQEKELQALNKLSSNDDENAIAISASEAQKIERDLQSQSSIDIAIHPALAADARRDTQQRTGGGTINLSVAEDEEGQSDGEGSSSHEDDEKAGEYVTPGGPGGGGPNLDDLDMEESEDLDESESNEMPLSTSTDAVVRQYRSFSNVHADREEMKEKMRRDDEKFGADLNKFTSAEDAVFAELGAN